MGYAVTITNTPVEIDPAFLEAASKFAARDRAKVLDFILKFQRDPTTPGIQLHQLRDASGLWSAKVSRGHRAILCKNGVWTLLHVDTHDEAYKWAEGRRVERTEEGVLRLIEVVEETAEVVEPSSEPPGSELGLFQAFEDAYLTSIGVPEDWLPTLRALLTEDQLFEAVERLPSDLADKLLTLVSGGVVAPPSPRPSWPPPDLFEKSILEQSELMLEHSNELERLGLRSRRGCPRGGITTAELGRQVGMTGSSFRMRLRIARLPQEVRDRIRHTPLAHGTYFLLQEVIRGGPRSTEEMLGIIERELARLCPASP